MSPPHNLGDNVGDGVPPGAEPMECVTCGRQTRYDRAVVAISGDGIVGGLCSDCEPESFSTLQPAEPTEAPAEPDNALAVPTEAPEESTDSLTEPTCDRCEREATVAYPEHKLEVSAVAGAEHERATYGVVAATPRRCADHAVATSPVEALLRVAGAGDGPGTESNEQATSSGGAGPVTVGRGADAR